MTIECNGCGCLMLGPVLDRSHEWLWWSCPCCPRNTRVAANAHNVIPFRSPQPNPHAVQPVR